jgi:hypothetical protein
MAIATIDDRGVKPSATTNTTVYTCPASTQAQLSLFICNQTTSSDTVRVAIIPSGGTIATTDYLLYDAAITADTPITIDKICLPAGAFIQVYTTNARCSFVPSGIEIT